MKFLQRFFKHLSMDDQFEIDKQFGLSLQCYWSVSLAIGYGIFYLSIRFYELLILMVFMIVNSFWMIMYNEKGGRHANGVICTGISIQSALVHFLVTYYVGDSGTVFFVLSAMMIPHLYPLLKLKHIISLDVMLFAVINVTFWFNLYHTPVYADRIGGPYRFILYNLGVIICFMELYVNIVSVNTLKAVRQRVVDDASKDAFIDALTGLGNRRLMSKYQSALESEIDAPLCLAMIDIDFFKKINDTYGHAIGDKVLINLADTMKGFFRKSDLLIRWGGEEFMAFLRYTEITQAEILMERFRIRIQETIMDIEDIKINITVTVGLAEHLHDAPLNESITKADEMLYMGKTQGRNRVML